MAILEVRNIEKHFGRTNVLKDVSFSMEEGNALAIIGSSGSGKTTLLRCLNFLERPDSGQIIVNGETLFDASEAGKDKDAELRKKRLHFGMVFQQFNLFPQYTALENVTLAERLLAQETPEFKKDKKAILTRIDEHGKELLDRMGLAERMNHYPHQLSGGQQQRAAIARALALKPDILCFDEPTSALDPELTDSVGEMLRDIAAKGTGVIVISHDRSFSEKYATRLYELGAKLSLIRG
jgi:polar amino acid transport system ATP-binding protein